MDEAAHYWTFLHLSASGTLQRKGADSAQAWFEQQLADLISQTKLPHRTIQRRLMPKVTLKPGEMSSAEACLRCYISHQVAYACHQLEVEYGQTYGVSRADLLPHVLDDDRLLSRRAQRSTYRAFATQVLDSFDPDQSGLMTWTVRLVRHHKEINAVLLEHGIYLVTDWAILNDTSLPQLERVLGGFHTLGRFQIEQASALLESYHAVYRHDRVVERDKGRCLPPNQGQLQRMSAYLKDEYAQSIPADQVRQQLQTLAQQLRAYRIYARTKVLPTESTDNPDQGPFVERLALEDSPEEDPAKAFLARYRQAFAGSLDEALQFVVEQRVAFLGKRKGDRPQRFIQGLHLFHCVGKTMGELAADIGYTRQDQVAYLLKLKPLRADVRQHMLNTLRDRIPPLAAAFRDPSQLQTLDQRLEAALEEQTADLIRETEVEASVARQGPLESRFARRLCHYLDQRTE
ncbi:MAG: hypothetical protein ACFB4J_10060 [Elainellaceae cyanobacterium]